MALASTTTRTLAPRVIVPISAMGSPFTRCIPHPLHSPSLTSKAHAGDGLG